MWQPQGSTVDGLELQMGINHFGHFALTALLMPALLRRSRSRVVSLSSLAHITARLDVDDLCYVRRRYDPQKVYSQTKLVNLMFSRELARRLAAAGAPTIAVAAHPGVASTNLFISAFPNAKRFGKVFDRMTAAVAQSSAQGALPSLYAATSQEVQNGDYIGPDGLFELWGHPGPTRSIAISNDEVAAGRIWEVSQQMTGITFPSLAASSLP
jgi:NAD(P)-dependent dehydrogenase (short-subunit alcohol dehydrogenase family)